MNIRVHRHDFAHLHHAPQLRQAPEPCPAWQFSSPFGQAAPGVMAGMAGLVGSALGQMLCPVPFLGAVLGGLIGSMMGSLMEALRHMMAAPCCGHTLGQQYGPMHQQMPGIYGFPHCYHEDFPLDPAYRPCLAQDFPNPPYGQAPPLFPQEKKPRAEVSWFPWGNSQTSQEVLRANERGQTSISLGGRNRQLQENVWGDNRGPQRATNLAGDNEQTQRNVHGDNASPQVATTVIGSNQQSQINETGDNRGPQVARTTVGGNHQVKTTASGQSSGGQTATTVLGDNTQVEIAGGSVVGAQDATTAIGDNRQVVVGGEGSVADQSAQTRLGSNDQTMVVGDNSIANQQARTSSGNNVQHLEGGANVAATQCAEGPGATTQTAALESGSLVQNGGRVQVAESLVGPVSIQQNGDDFGDNQQNAQGSEHDDQVDQRAGQGFLTLFDKNTTSNAQLGGGNDHYTYEGNSENNHLRLDGGAGSVGSDQDVARISTHGGDDTGVVNLSADRDTYQVDMGRGDDRLVVNEDGQRIRILGDGGQEIYRSQGWSESDSTATVSGAEALNVYRQDGTFARWTSEGGLQEGRDSGQPGQMTPLAAARTLREYAGHLDKAAGTGEVDGILGRGDLRAALDNPDTPQELRQAIEYTLGNEAMWRGLDASGGRENRVDLAGLNRFIDGYETRPSYDAEAPMSDRQAVSVLNYHNAMLDTAASGGSADGRFNVDDLQAVLGPSNQNLPPELRAAAQHLLSNDSFAQRLDNTSWEMELPFGQQTFTNEDLARFAG